MRNLFKVLTVASLGIIFTACASYRPILDENPKYSKVEGAALGGVLGAICGNGLQGAQPLELAPVLKVLMLTKKLKTI